MNSGEQIQCTRRRLSSSSRLTWRCLASTRWLRGREARRGVLDPEVGEGGAEVDGEVTVALDITEDVVEEAEVVEAMVSTAPSSFFLI